jgi:SAM-dependent methyltransferase
MKETPISLDTVNAAFWNELCGTTLARSLGVTDDSPASLKRFDEWYLGLYPYLPRHIPFHEMRGKRVLEVGLGYGTVAQRIGEAGARLSGLDVAAGPVALVNRRCTLQGIDGRAVQGSILAAPFAGETFDFVVAIGSYHHTGDLQRAVDETRRVLKPGGRLALMVYNGYSYRRWLRAAGDTARYFLWDKLGLGRPPAAPDRNRRAYDVNTEGQPAPHTDFISRAHLQRICRGFVDFDAHLENIAQEGPFRFWRRETLLEGLPRFVGLDIYASARKP